MQVVPSSDDELNDEDLPHGLCTPSSADVMDSHRRPHDDQPLVLWQGIVLLTAECVGVGILALPNNVQTLGYGMGLGFLLLNIPINFVAGDYLSQIALHLETTDNIHLHDEGKHDLQLTNEHDENDDDQAIELSVTNGNPLTPPPPTTTTTTTELHHRYSNASIQTPRLNLEEGCRIEGFQDEPDGIMDDMDDLDCRPTYGTIATGTPLSEQHYHSTQDLVGISRSIFRSRHAIHLVVGLYYLNLFLVLGDYILVMGRAVAAVTRNSLCLPVAGMIASVLMFGICQFRTMALLGRKVSLASILAMLIVLLQCLFHHKSTTSDNTAFQHEKRQDDTIWAKFSALAGIGFAVGSQKLFLNVRHELLHKEDSSKVLAGSLTTYGSAYLMVILLAGSNPPSFLFDAIPLGWSRQVAGLLLWGHVAVSYAINSQALCSSMDRFLVASEQWQQMDDQKRWFWLTLAVAISSYLVSNAVPFFKDLVALIGALTSVPLTLTLPALLYRTFHRLPVYCFQWNKAGESKPKSGGSCSLLLYSVAFLVIGLVGAISSIDQDWLNQGRPFACHQ